MTVSQTQIMVLSLSGFNYLFGEMCVMPGRMVWTLSVERGARHRHHLIVMLKRINGCQVVKIEASQRRRSITLPDRDDHEELAASWVWSLALVVTTSSASQRGKKVQALHVVGSFDLYTFETIFPGAITVAAGLHRAPRGCFEIFLARPLVHHQASTFPDSVLVR